MSQDVVRWESSWKHPVVLLLPLGFNLSWRSKATHMGNPQGSSTWWTFRRMVCVMDPVQFNLMVATFYGFGFLNRTWYGHGIDLCWLCLPMASHGHLEQVKKLMNCQEGTDLTLTHTSPVISIAAPGVKLRKVVSSPKDFSRFVCVASICLAFYLKGLLWPNLIPIPLRIPLGLSLVFTPFFFRYSIPGGGRLHGISTSIWDYQSQRTS